MRSETPFDDLLATLQEPEPPRVWSLIVTVFGDLAEDTAFSVTGVTLQRLFSRLGIKPEALRVALHRLRKDGWIDSQKVGRQSAYSLTPHGQRESDAARPRIYAEAQTNAACWLVLTDPALDHRPSEGAVPIGAGQWLSAGVVDGRETLCLPLDTAPDWMQNALCSDALCDACTALAHDLAAAHKLLGTNPDLSADDITLLRIMIVHRWRKIALRVPNLPDAILPAELPYAHTRGLVSACLSALPRPSL